MGSPLEEPLDEAAGIKDGPLITACITVDLNDADLECLPCCTEVMDILQTQAKNISRPFCRPGPSHPDLLDRRLFVLVNAADADVVFRSSDGVLFHIHSKNLEVNTDGFPPVTPELSPQGSFVNLTENAKTLDLMFRFVYPRLIPPLDDVDYDTLAALAEAVEKYQVHTGKQLCSIFMT
ncbi:hypothetical protein DXG03_002391, partial [Asterophora parasitica]